MLSEGKVGPQISSDGAQSTLRLDKTGALCIAQSHGAYTEAAYRGSLMECCNAVAGVDHLASLTVAPPLFLWNPPSSGKNLSILKVAMGYVSGTLGAGNIALGAVTSQTTVPSGGTELTPLNSLIGMPRGVGRVFSLSTVIQPVIVRPIFNMGPMLATSVYQPTDCVDVLDGSIVVTPGSGVCLSGICTAGTSPKVILGFTWEELPI